MFRRGNVSSRNFLVLDDPGADDPTLDGPIRDCFIVSTTTLAPGGSAVTGVTGNTDHRATV